MASLPGAVMKKSSGYGSALGRARAISVSARAGPAVLLAAAAASRTTSGRWRRRYAPDRRPFRSAGSVWPAASLRRPPHRRSVHPRSGTAGSSGVAASFKDSVSRKVRLIASAKRCQRARRVNNACACWLALAAAYPAISPSASASSLPPKPVHSPAA